MATMRRTLVIGWDVLVTMLVGTTLTAMVLGTIVLTFGVVGILALMVVARLATTTVAWPNPEVVAMRASVEQLLPPPPTASFVGATITTFYDGDRWRCVEYRTSATAQETRAYYERAKQAMFWGANDSYGFEGPDHVQRTRIAKDATITVRPWDLGALAGPGEIPRPSAFPQHGAFTATPPSQHLSVCYSYETWYFPETRTWPTRPRRPMVTVPWPDPAVVDLRERFERAYPPDPSWAFTGATLTRHPDGWRLLCVSYQTGISADDTRAYYERARRTRSGAWTQGTPELGKASVKATDGAVTVCPL